MGRIYRIPLANTAVTAQVDLLEVVAAATKIVELLELFLSQVTEVADAQEEMLAIAIKTGMTTSGSGGSSATPVPNELGDAAYGGTAEVFNTTKSQDGTIVTHERHNWNIRVPFNRIWIPEARIVLPPSARMAVELATTPTDSITIGGFATIREVG